MIQNQTGETVVIMDEFKLNSSSQYEAVEATDQSFTEISSSVVDVGNQDKNAIIDAISNISSVS